MTPTLLGRIPRLSKMVTTSSSNWHSSMFLRELDKRKQNKPKKCWRKNLEPQLQTASVAKKKEQGRAHDLWRYNYAAYVVRKLSSRWVEVSLTLNQTSQYGSAKRLHQPQRSLTKRNVIPRTGTVFDAVYSVADHTNNRESKAVTMTLMLQSGQNQGIFSPTTRQISSRFRRMWSKTITRFGKSCIMRSEDIALSRQLFYNFAQSALSDTSWCNGSKQTKSRYL